MSQKVRLLDCTVRDGGYVLGWGQPPQYVTDVIRYASRCRIDYVEVGLCNDRHRDSSWWDAVRPDMITAAWPKDMAPFGEEWPQVVGMVDFGKQSPDLLDWIGLDLDVLRIACRMEDAAGAFKYAAEVKAKTHVDCCVNVMAMSTLGVGDVGRILALAKDHRPWGVYLADSFGAVMPDVVARQFDLLSPLTELGTRLGFHGHNNLQLAFANSLVAAEHGASLIDCTCDGVGRGGGNLTTELAVSKWGDRNGIGDLERFYNKWLYPFHNMSGVNWGPGYEELATALANAHPNYATVKDPSIQSFDDLMYRLGKLSDSDRVKFMPNTFIKEGYADGL